ncbi:DUF5333 domain-containing protein [Roseobacter ponti]|uniref:DUF5333 domain-containing protein n=1 Tax=Roseobacter ponti TaxID=1891787 RepID=A0A858SS90_9RHOB|nr:DUF5333 domain-containing protein [Roseobacter ponti]QJF50857.1 DUF5333 domain-containing protein [Roseobacter ponti]
MTRLILSAAVMLSLATSASAKPALRDVPEIDNGLFTVGLADQIRKNCPDISARFFRALSYLKGLENEARDRGYTEAEVEAHLDSDAEKDRLRARARDYMKTRGHGQDQQGYCALGREEISRGSAIGALLRATN